MSLPYEPIYEHINHKISYCCGWFRAALNVSSILQSGWLHKELRSGAKSSSVKLKKRWFVLTSNSLDYYKSSERSSSKLGTLVLNSLCSVVQPDEKVFKDTGEDDHRPHRGSASFVNYSACCPLKNPASLTPARIGRR